MCGLAGVLDPSVSTSAEELTAVVATMAATLIHRGPDDRGAWVDESCGIGLGFQRLSIQDLSLAGHQPMVSASGRYVMVFNGEIYDQRVHRAALEARGVRFRGTSDTEVLLECFEDRGVDRTLRDVTGMFALALWDRTERTLTLARDRFGEKPLYWGWAGPVLVFGSELRALRAHPLFEERVNRSALATYLQLGYVSGSASVLERVWRLPPASYLQVTAGEIAPVPRQYWAATAVAADAAARRPKYDEPTALQALDHLLAEVIPARLIADVPLGAFLSGGIDSATVVAYAQRGSSTPLRTFTMGFDDVRFDETDDARAVAKHLGTDHTEVTVTGDDALGVVDRLPAIYDEPFADPSQIPTFLMCELARREVTVALSGDGGDELFLGYDRYRWARDAWRTQRVLPRALREIAARGLDVVQPGTRLGRVTVAGRPMAQSAERLGRVLRATGTGSFYRAICSHWSDPHALVGASPADDWAPSAAPWTFPEAAAIVDSVAYLPDDILVKVDRAAMASSLETRAPLLDQRLFDFAWSLPVAARLRGHVGKHLLRELLYQQVPRTLVDRPKRGFGVPLAAWLRGPLKEWGADLLDASRLSADGVFAPDVVTKAWHQHQSGVANHEYRLWDVLMFQAWAGV